MGARSDGPTLCVFRLVTGLPCPFCGSTRSLFELGQADLAASIELSPIGWALPIIAVAVLLQLALARRERPARLWPPALLATGGVAVLVAWMVQLAKENAGMTRRIRREAGAAGARLPEPAERAGGGGGAGAGQPGTDHLLDLRALRWWQGQKARAAVDQSGERWDGRGMATAGWIMGIIGTVTAQHQPDCRRRAGSVPCG